MNIFNKLLNKFKKTTNIQPINNSFHIKCVEDKYKTPIPDFDQAIQDYLEIISEEGE